MSTREVGIPHVSVTVDENALQCGAIKILKTIRPTWNEENIEFKLLTDGITNKLVGCRRADLDEEETVLIRVYGNKTDLLIDRKAETSNIQFLNKLDLAPDLYATFENGLAYKYIPGRTLTVDSVRDPDIYHLVAKRMAQLHKASHSEHSQKPMIWKKIEQFLNIVPDTFSDAEKQKRYLKEGIPKAILKQELEDLKEKLENTTNPVVFAHNDLLLGNVIYTEATNSVTFIDYEYAGYNYQSFDIANHFVEFAGLDVTNFSEFPSKELQTDWLIHYLNEFNNRKPTDEEIEQLYVQVNQFVLVSHIFWGIWAFIQTEHSYIDFDFFGYGLFRFKEYFDKKKNLLSLKRPDK